MGSGRLWQAAALAAGVFFLVSSCNRRDTDRSTKAELLVASFNLKSYGDAKAANAAIVQTIARIITRYDIVAVQEIRDADGSAVRDLANAVVAVNAAYRIVLGERLGRSRYKEQYAIFYDSSRLLLDGAPYTYDDDNDGNGANAIDDTGLDDLFEREPLFAHFKTTDGGFDFTVGDIHVKPSDAAVEIARLPMAISDAAGHYDEADVLVCGDFNADGSYYDENAVASVFPPSDFLWLIGNEVDTTVASSNNTYDRIVGTATMAEDSAGRGGAFRFDEELDLASLGLRAADISDHYPVWAAFSSSKDTD